MPDSLQFQLQNQTDSDKVYAYITGLALQSNSARVLVQADGHSLYFPSSPSAIGTPLAVDCAIPLGPPGHSTSVTIPQLAGGRLWFARGAQLTFLLNPGPALVEPSVLNASDPNAGVDFAFAEFTLNADQLFANISFVDFVPRLALALELRSRGGSVQRAAGLPPDGLQRVCDGLRAQAQQDGRPWDKLIVQPAGEAAPLRALNPTHADAVGADFSNYWEPYVDKVWQRYGGSGGGAGPSLRINTQAAPGILGGSVNAAGELVVGKQTFARPSSADVFGCNSGPFAPGGEPERLALVPRLAAAMARSTLATEAEQPAHPRAFYRDQVTNHYARVVHETSVDGRGYAFAFDDVQPDGGEDQSGKVNAGDPELLTVVVSGGRAGLQQQAGGEGALSGLQGLAQKILR